MAEEIELELKWREYHEELEQGGTNMTFKDWCRAKELGKCLEGEEIEKWNTIVRLTG